MIGNTKNNIFWMLLCNDDILIMQGKHQTKQKNMTRRGNDQDPNDFKDYIEIIIAVNVSCVDCKMS